MRALFYAFQECGVEVQTAKSRKDLIAWHALGIADSSAAFGFGMTRIKAE
jgi:hypothetical protein